MEGDCGGEGGGSVGLGAPAPRPTPTPSGALLFSVMGGKMSEGINFSDDLARCVAVVGMPYGNPSDPELKERMAYLDRRAAGGSGGAGVGAGAGAGEVVVHAHAGPRGSSTGREYYENLCLRVVNQSIGRSIRHVGDHAVILLLDARYSQPHIRAKLPGWMGDRVTVHPAWGSVAAGVGAFFKRKRDILAAAQANR